MKPFVVLLAGSLAAVAHADQTTTLKEITVTAKVVADEERQSAITQKTVIDRKEIEALGGLTVSEVIRKLPGIEAGEHTSDGGPSANARGMGRDSVQFLVDGERPSANSRYALTTVGRLPSGELERVEILRGSSAEHGGGAAVTVNLIMRKARASTSTSLKAAVGMRGGEPNGQFTLSQSGGDKDFSWVLPLTVNHHGMPLKKNLQRRQSSAGTPTLWQAEQESSPYQLNELIVSPRLSWRSAQGSLSLWPSLYHNRGERKADIGRQAFADPVNGSGLASDGSRHESEKSQLTIARVRAEGERRTDWGKLSGRAALMGSQREQDTDRVWVDALGGRSAGLEAIDRKEREFSSALRLDKGVGEGMLAIGLEQSWLRRDESQRVSGASTHAADFDSAARQWTAWAQHEWPVAKSLTLTYGLRGEHVSLESDGHERSTSQLAPSLAARYEIAPDLIVRSSIGAGLKMPKLDEISALNVRGAGYNSPLEADRAGNPGLQAERSLNWELGIDKHLPQEAGTVGANVYLRRTKDFIERRTSLEGARWVDRSYNEGPARHWGLELDAKLKGDALGWKGASVRSHLTLPQARVDDERLGLHRDARDLPRYQWSLALDQSLPAWQASAGFSLNQHGATKTEVPGEIVTRQKSRTMLDLYMARRLTPQLNVRLEVQNVLGTDTRRLARASHASDDWSLSSHERGQRAVLLSLEGKW